MKFLIAVVAIFALTGAVPMPPEVDAVQVRQYFPEACEEQLNAHVKYEMFVSQIYLSMSTYFSRWDVALPGFAKKFRHYSDEERDHGIQILDYVNKRGGLAKMPLNIDVSEYSAQVESNDWSSVLNVLQTALKIERLINSRFVDHVRLCANNQNYHMEDWIDSVFMKEQVHAIYELGQMITEIKMIGTSHVNNFGLYHYDKHLSK